MVLITHDYKRKNKKKRNFLDKNMHYYIIILYYNIKYFNKSKNHF